MNWFERHLNWTMVFGLLGTYVAGFMVGAVIYSVDPYVSDGAMYIIGFIVSLAILIPVWGWALRRKSRSLWWLLMGLFVPFGFIVLLCLDNKSPAAELSMLLGSLSVTDKGAAAVSYSRNPGSIGERESKILETVSHSPGISVKEVADRTKTDIFDIRTLVDAGLLKSS